MVVVADGGADSAMEASAAALVEPALELPESSRIFTQQNIHKADGRIKNCTNLSRVNITVGEQAESLCR